MRSNKEEKIVKRKGCKENEKANKRNKNNRKNNSFFKHSFIFICILNKEKCSLFFFAKKEGVSNERI